ncbi:hypothetical protein, partial [Streptococcus pneumoniae]
MMKFILDIVSTPAILVALIAILGLVLQKKKLPDPQLFTPNLKTIQNPCLSLDPGWFLFSPNG